jgi:hypothetical protein
MGENQNKGRGKKQPGTLATHGINPAPVHRLANASCYVYGEVKM